MSKGNQFGLFSLMFHRGMQKHAFLLTFVSQIRTKKEKSLVTEIQLTLDFKWPQRSWKY